MTLTLAAGWSSESGFKQLMCNIEFDLGSSTTTKLVIQQLAGDWPIAPDKIAYCLLSQ